MKRDLDLIRRVLLDIEASEGEAPREIRLGDVSDDEINYHLALMIEAGLLQGQVSRTLGPGVPRVRRSLPAGSRIRLGPAAAPR